MDDLEADFLTDFVDRKKEDDSGDKEFVVWIVVVGDDFLVVVDEG